MMKNKISFLLLLLVTALGFTACDDNEVEPFLNPYRLAIGGPDEVAPGTSRDFTIGSVENADAYSWSVEGPAQIVGAATGATITVQFQSVGEAIITATNGSDTGKLTVEIADVAPAVSATLDTTSTGAMKALRNGQSDTVFFHFDAPLSVMPTLAINTEDSTAYNKGEDPFVSGSLGSLTKASDSEYYAIYTAGAGNGTPEAKLSNIIATSAYGSDTVNAAYVQLFRVDNIAPVADITYSQNRANKGSMVTATVTFSEEVMSANGGMLFAMLSGGGISERDTLMATANPRVYTIDHMVSGDGNGAVQVQLQNIVDYAGNALAGTNNGSMLVVDNIRPVVTGNSIDSGTSATITIGSSEAGTGMYVILNAAATAPTTATAFMDATGVASRSVSFTTPGVMTVSQALAKGSYKVYYMAMDEAGNYSSITSSNLVMD